jgi:hypothetical protein
LLLSLHLHHASKIIENHQMLQAILIAGHRLVFALLIEATAKIIDKK